jgi:hypothetical protein
MQENQLEPISKEEFGQWKRSPVTQKLFKLFNITEDDSLNILLSDHLIRSSLPNEDLKRLGYLTGVIRTIRQLKEMEFNEESQQIEIRGL